MAILDSRAALIVGAGPGIGRACAVALGSAGADVMLAARDGDRLAALAGELADATGRTVKCHTVDVGDIASGEELVRHTEATFGRLDVLVNVATSGGAHEPVRDADWDSWRQAFEVNVVGTMALSRAAARVMEARGGGSIVQIGTVGTHALPTGRARYTATKQAMVTASLTMAKELGPSGVRVNVVTPGFTTGAPLDALIHSMAERRGSTVEEASRALAASASLRHHVEPSDVAEAVLFLAGPTARSITGIELPVTAGR